MANPTQAQIDKLTTNLSRYDSIINGDFNETITLDSHTVKSISGYLSELAANTLRGLWATATTYAIKDIVEESGNWYVCLEAHSSGTFATDLAANKWALYQINLSGDLTLTGDLDISGGVTVDTNTLVVDPLNNRVGIGTSSPFHKLDILLNQTSFRTYDFGSEITVDTTAPWARAFRLRNEDSGSAVTFGTISGTAFIATGFDPDTDSTGYLSRKFSVDPTGKVFMPNLATSGTDNGTLKYNSSTGEIWVG